MLRTALFLALALATAPAFGIGNDFTYQGTLTDTGAAANGSYDLQFTLQDSRDLPLGTPIVLDNVAVANGVFTVKLDFGPNAFSGAIRKLQVGVRAGVSTGAFTLLAPATTITSTPHALVAGNALVATTVEDGAIGPAQLADNAVTSSKIATGAIADSDIASRGISGQSIAVGTIDDTNLATNAVTSAKIADATITGADIASATITGQNIASGTVGNANLALNAVTTSRIADGTITDADMAFHTITSQSISPGAIGTSQVVTNAFWNGFGNAGTNPAVHFIGTTDGQSLQIKAPKVGINTATPAVPLDVTQSGGADTAYNAAVARFNVTSTSDVSIVRSGNGPAIQLDDDGNHAQISYTTYDNVHFLSFYDGLTHLELTTILTPEDQKAVRFELHNPPNSEAYAIMQGGGPWSSFSDIRLKHNVLPLTGALDHLLQLRSVTFEYNNTDDGRFPQGVHTGFVAQEVQQVFPDWVNTGPDGYLVVGSKGFESLTVQALRELRAEKDDEIAALKDENATLRARLDIIEARLGRR